MDVYESLCRLKAKIPADDFKDIREQFYINDPSTSFNQATEILSRSNGMSDEVVEKFLHLGTDPGYAMQVSRVFQQFDLLQQAQQFLPPTNFARFVECFEFARLDITYATVMGHLLQLKQQQLTPQLGEKLEHLLDQHFGGYLDTNKRLQTSYPTEQQFAPGMELLMQQAFIALQHDPAMCQQFISILDYDQMNGIPFADSIMNVYQWIQEKDPSLWYPLASVLEQMQTLQESESNQYESYEDFVQKNFLDDDGQEYLDGEIEQARVQHLFSNMSM
ncbi:hypothetical protein BCR42DRAFT_402152 [Absidia repens]|uniref:Uncharacterized protein n=1 Tax=Absidia repens TaxID=90262 RepID=A0A1X2IXN6_9FUNG|nr:hypothetical protein BCR42DRAFT_402152 [Absidia repens]